MLLFKYVIISYWVILKTGCTKLFVKTNSANNVQVTMISHSLHYFSHAKAYSTFL